MNMTYLAAYFTFFGVFSGRKKIELVLCQHLLMGIFAPGNGLPKRP